MVGDAGDTRSLADAMRGIDIAYYLIFGSFVLFTLVFTPPTDMGSLTFADWLARHRLPLDPMGQTRNRQTPSQLALQ